MTATMRRPRISAIICHSCQAKGQDVIAFMRLRYRLDFKSACIELGAWQGKRTISGGDVVRLQREREQRERDQTDREEDDRRERLRARNILHQLERAYLAANTRLAQLRRGVPQKYRGEEALAWWFLSDTLPRIREAESNYRQLAGLEAL